MSTRHSGPLTGVVVIDLTRHLPGPYAVRMLHNLGARVVKVEEPAAGDPLRAAPPFAGGKSTLASALLRGVESIALDLKLAGGRAVLEALLDNADVLVETFRPGTLERLGLPPDDLCRRNERLVGCSISGWGTDGPRAARAGHDLTYLAAAGALGATGQMPHVPSADLLGAWSAATAISAALFARERSGRGAWIDASLFDAAFVGNVTNVGSAERARRQMPSRGLLTGSLPCYRLYRAGDGVLVALAALERKFWNRFCSAIERPDLVGLQYRGDLDSHARVEAVLADRTSTQWQRLFDELDVPGEVVAAADDALHCEQARVRGLRDPRQDGVQFPARFDGRRPAGGERFPRLGEHTAAIVAEFCPQLWHRSRRRRLALGIGPRIRLKRLLAGRLGRFGR